MDYFLNSVVTCPILMFMYPCIVSINVNDEQQDATILAYLFIPSQLTMNK